MNTIKLALDSDLAVSGEYTIEVVTVDKRGNKSPDPSIHQFTVEDKSAPIVVANTVQPRPTDFDSEGNPINPLTQPVEGVSAILSDGLTGSGVDLDNSAIYLRNSVDEIIEGDVIVDEENNKLNYVLKEPLKVSDTYTIVVIGTDFGGAKGVHTFQFVLDMAENIVVRYEGKTYLVIYASTTVVDFPTPGGTDILTVDDILQSITVQKTSDFPAMVSELSNITGFAIEFQPHDMTLSQEAELTLYYEDDQLPLGIAETELSIYAYKSQARDWVQLPDAAQSEEDNKLTANISTIDQYYIVAYTSPVAPSLVDAVTLNPPQYFNPDAEVVTFTFARNMTDYQVEIYNVAGDRIVSLEEKGGSDKSLAWDG
jgi:hypothetical protein